MNHPQVIPGHHFHGCYLHHPQTEGLTPPARQTASGLWRTSAKLCGSRFCDTRGDLGMKYGGFHWGSMRGPEMVVPQELDGLYWKIHENPIQIDLKWMIWGYQSETSIW